MNVSVGLIEGPSAAEVELKGAFTDTSGKPYASGRHRFDSEITLTPSDPASCAFALDDVTIGIGFHWERKERQVFRGALRLLRRDTGLTIINDVPLEEYVTSVISSEMSASCPLEMLKAHAVISRSWLWFPKANPPPIARGQALDAHEIIRWYGRESHPDFDVCADDHCQRYQGITKAFSPAAAQAVVATTGEFLRHNGAICDARFSKCCGGMTERYATAWEDQNIPYLESIYDGPLRSAADDPETWIRSRPPAYCNTDDVELLARVLPGFDQETRDFYRWRVAYTPEELGDLVKSRLGADLGPVRDLQPLARGPSGRIYRLKIIGERDYIIIGKELEIRRALSRTHLYSSAFVMDKESDRFVLRGAGWGHGVGLCQIGAAVMANAGKTYIEILQHYYRQTTVSV
ncbi:MAG TPA: SpoIID/LytB domain-containing protein [Candidatus Binataceae bacterium]|nr:SpoIID/LytB domain-containing protein [Candidatus Binataceae bacterium]